jgi:transposase
MPQIGIDAFNMMGIAFIMYVSNMLSPKINVTIRKIAIGTIELRWRRVINKFLYAPRRFVVSRLKPYNLSRLTADQGHNISILFRFCAHFLADEPI